MLLILLILLLIVLTLLLPVPISILPIGPELPPLDILNDLLLNLLKIKLPIIDINLMRRGNGHLILFLLLLVGGGVVLL